MNSGATAKDLMTARLFFNAAFPVMKVVLEDDPAMRAKFRGTNALVQIGAWNGDSLLAYCLTFEQGALSVTEGPASRKPDIALTFRSVARMNTMFRGGLALPSVKGLGKPLLLLNVFSLLMSLMLMMPTSRPKASGRRRLKVKMSLYMITRALSVYNKLGDPDMAAWCRRQPERIYQFLVDGGQGQEPIACYLRVRAGQSKSGHGVYTRRAPFVLFHFFSVEGALKVLLKDVAFVEGVERHYVEIVGSPEYAMHLNDFMSILQSLLTTAPAA